MSSGSLLARHLALAVAVITVGVTFGVLALPAFVPQIFGLTLLAVAVMRDRTVPVLPLLLRPGTLVLIVTIAISLCTQLLSASDLELYDRLQLVQLAGMGAALIPRLQAADSRRGGVFSEGVVYRVSLICFFVCLAAALLFFVGYGVPALAGNVEEARDSAAVHGTGLIRLLAYMTIPLSVLMVAMRGRRVWWSPTIAGLIVLGMGNRSPVVYLGICLLVLIYVGVKHRPSSKWVAGAMLGIFVFLGSVATYRVLSEQTFRQYPQYASLIATHDYAGIAWFSLTHYATVIPQNTVRTVRLVQTGVLHPQYGATYASLFTTALPGKTIPLDRTIKELTGSTFVGGGIPPTLIGEGYVNFGYLGVAGSAFVLLLFVRLAARRLEEAQRGLDRPSVRTWASLYGLLLGWNLFAQIAGAAGASTFINAALLLALGIMWVAFRRRRSLVAA